MNAYKQIIEEADSHANMVVRSFKKKKFDNIFLLNLVTMSMEKFMVGYLISKDNLPSGHTLSFLVQEMTNYTSIPESDINLIEDLDDKIQLCSLEVVAPYIPTDKEMEVILDTMTNIQSIVKNEIAEGETV